MHCNSDTHAHDVRGRSRHPTTPLVNKHSTLSSDRSSEHRIATRARKRHNSKTRSWYAAVPASVGPALSHSRSLLSLLCTHQVTRPLQHGPAPPPQPPHDQDAHPPRPCRHPPRRHPPSRAAVAPECAAAGAARKTRRPPRPPQPRNLLFLRRFHLLLRRPKQVINT